MLLAQSCRDRFTHAGPRTLPDLEVFAVGLVSKLKVFREAAGQAAPDAISVQLKRLAQLLDL